MNTFQMDGLRIQRRRGVMFVAAWLIAVATPAQAAPAELGTLLSALAGRTNAVNSYRADIRLDVHLQSFPFLKATFSGTETYAKPGHYSVNFNRLPSLAKAYQKISGEVDDPGQWQDRYNISIEPNPPTGDAVALRLTEKVRGEISYVRANVDLPTKTVTHMEWHYYHNGYITLDQHFLPVDGILLTDRQSAAIHMPTLKASAVAYFNHYVLQAGAANGDNARNHRR